MNQSKASQFHQGVERVYQTKVLPEFWKAKEEGAKTGDPDAALPFTETQRALPNNDDPQHKMFGPVVFVTSLDDFGKTEGKPGFVSELYLRHAAEAIFRGTHRLATAKEVHQWRKDGEERRLAMMATERKIASTRALTLEDANMPKPLDPAAAAPVFTATVNGAVISAPTAAGLQAILAALQPAATAKAAK